MRHTCDACPCLPLLAPSAVLAVEAYEASAEACLRAGDHGEFLKCQARQPAVTLRFCSNVRQPCAHKELQAAGLALPLMNRNRAWKIAPSTRPPPPSSIGPQQRLVRELYPGHAGTPAASRMGEFAACGVLYFACVPTPPDAAEARLNPPSIMPLLATVSHTSSCSALFSIDTSLQRGGFN